MIDFLDNLYEVWFEFITYVNELLGDLLRWDKLLPLFIFIFAPIISGFVVGLLRRIKNS